MHPFIRPSEDSVRYHLSSKPICLQRPVIWPDLSPQRLKARPFILSNDRSSFPTTGYIIALVRLVLKYGRLSPRRLKDRPGKSAHRKSPRKEGSTTVSLLWKTRLVSYVPASASDSEAFSLLLLSVSLSLFLSISNNLFSIDQSSLIKLIGTGGISSSSSSKHHHEHPPTLGRTGTCHMPDSWWAIRQPSRPMAPHSERGAHRPHHPSHHQHLRSASPT